MTRKKLTENNCRERKFTTVDHQESVDESSKFSKILKFRTPFLKFAVYPLNILNFKFKWSNILRQTSNKSGIMVSLIQHFVADILESQPQNPEFRNIWRSGVSSPMHAASHQLE